MAKKVFLLGMMIVNVKFFFVKDFNDFVCSPERILKNENVEKNPKLKNAIQSAITEKNPQAVEYAYSELLRAVAKSFHGNIDTLYNGNLFCSTDIDGLKFDFNFGLRLEIPKGNWRVKISDYDSGQIFFDENVSDTRLISSDFYYIHWKIEIFRKGKNIFSYVFEPENLPVLFVCTSKALGDTLAFMPYVREFQKVHKCKVSIWCREYLREVLANFYPEFEQVEQPSLNYYATFYGSFIIGELLSLPADSRTISLDRIGGMILDIKNIPQIPKFTPTKNREIAEPYVCIAVQASSTPKGWLYPKGWDIVVNYLKSLGYRVLCIDKNKIYTEYGYTIQKPEQAEDFTGNIPLIDRANMLYHAEFFIGLSSGLSWLAYYVNCPVVMISGFTQDKNEFYTPYRVANRFVCNGCYNDIKAPTFGSKICHKYNGTDRELECQKKIFPRQVINAIEKLIVEKNLIPPVLQ